MKPMSEKSITIRSFLFSIGLLFSVVGAVEAIPFIVFVMLYAVGIGLPDFIFNTAGVMSVASIILGATFVYFGLGGVAVKREKAVVFKEEAKRSQVVFNDVEAILKARGHIVRKELVVLSRKLNKVN
jgi:hypothetical protein